MLLPKTYDKARYFVDMRADRIIRDTNKWLSGASNRILLASFRELIAHHEDVHSVIRRNSLSYLGESSFIRLAETEIEIGAHVTEIIKRGYSIAKIF